MPRRRSFALHPLQDGKLRAPIHGRYQRPPVSRAHDRFQLPIADPALRGHHRRPLRKVDPIGNVAASGRTTAAPVRLLAPTSPAPVPRPSGLPVGPHLRVDPLLARHHLARLPVPARDLLRAPAFLPPVLDHRPALGGPLPGHRRRCLATGRGLAVSLLVTVAALPTVAQGLARDRRRIPSEIAGHLPFRKPPVQPGVNRASFGMGQGVVTYGHDHPPLVRNRDGCPSSGPLQAFHLTSQRFRGCCTSHWKGGAKKQDVILFYALSREAWKNYTIPVTQKYLDSHNRHIDAQGRRCRIRVDGGKRAFIIQAKASFVMIGGQILTMSTRKPKNARATPLKNRLHYFSA